MYVIEREFPHRTGSGSIYEATTCSNPLKRFHYTLVDKSTTR